VVTIKLPTDPFFGGKLGKIAEIGGHLAEKILHFRGDHACPQLQGFGGLPVEGPGRVGEELAFHGPQAAAVDTTSSSKSGKRESRQKASRTFLCREKEARGMAGMIAEGCRRQDQKEWPAACA
jgi:hypothetical protein